MSTVRGHREDDVRALVSRLDTEDLAAHTSEALEEIGWSQSTVDALTEVESENFTVLLAECERRGLITLH